jgi:hypothetical protein
MRSTAACSAWVHVLSWPPTARLLGCRPDSGASTSAADLQRQVAYWQDAFSRLARAAGAGLPPGAPPQQDAAEGAIQEVQQARQQDAWAQVRGGAQCWRGWRRQRARASACRCLCRHVAAACRPLCAPTWLYPTTARRRRHGRQRCKYRTRTSAGKTCCCGARCAAGGRPPSPA